MQDRKTEQQIIEALGELGGQIAAADDLIFEGNTFVVPANMDHDDAINFLVDKRAEANQHTVFSRQYRYRPNDGARATATVLKRTFGATVAVSTWRESAELRTVAVDANRTEQVPWGKLEIPALDGAVLILGDYHDDTYGDLFVLYIHGPRRYRYQAEGIFNLIEEELRTNSMYRGKAFDGSDQFMDLSAVNPANVTYSDDVMTQLDANLWSMLRHSDLLKVNGVSLKRAVLLEGPYGTGKSEAARITAKVATDNGWTFLNCRPEDDMAAVMRTAELYQPAVVFFEDVDTIADPANTDADAASKLLDMFDGIGNKDTAILAVMTTNHVDRIHKGMLRPGRLDAIIHIGLLDRDAFERLIRNTVPSALLSENVSYGVVFEACHGYTPAFVREVVSRAVRYAIARFDGDVRALNSAGPIIDTQALVDSANGLRAQFELLQQADEHGASEPSLDAAVAYQVRKALEPALTELDGQIVRQNLRTRNVVENEGEATRERAEGIIDHTVVLDAYGDRDGHKLFVADD